mmetsp:Transcript_31040/g.64918  ORF Transcript_31040/g.64918 Transcript_31040/m.64918 type:complete len:91 (-) Transcript_31040:3526-3798(-)
MTSHIDVSCGEGGSSSFSLWISTVQNGKNARYVTMQINATSVPATTRNTQYACKTDLKVKLTPGPPKKSNPLRKDCTARACTSKGKLYAA